MGKKAEALNRLEIEVNEIKNYIEDRLDAIESTIHRRFSAIEAMLVKLTERQSRSPASAIPAPQEINQDHKDEEDGEEEEEEDEEDDDDDGNMEDEDHVTSDSSSSSLSAKGKRKTNVDDINTASSAAPTKKVKTEDVKMLIYVKTPAGITIAVEVKSLDTIRNVEAKIQDKDKDAFTKVLKRISKILKTNSGWSS